MWVCICFHTLHLPLEKENPGGHELIWSDERYACMSWVLVPVLAVTPASTGIGELKKEGKSELFAYENVVVDVPTQPSHVLLEQDIEIGKF